MKAVMDDNKMSTKIKIFYGAIILVCIIAIIVAICVQFAGEDKEMPLEPEKPVSNENTQEQYKTEFDNMFENKVNYLSNNNYTIKEKIDSQKEIIYVGYESDDKKVNNYELDVNIPYINIKSEQADKFNKAIKDTFEKKAKSVLNNNNNNVLYTVKYTAYVTNNILSLVIKSTLKEDNNPQRNIIQTYNYNLKNEKECTIQDLLEMKGITKQQANEKIKEEIENVQKTVDELEKAGYNVFSRNPENDMYSINNVTEYFIGEDNIIYVIFAYGNQSNTSEMDIVLM